MHDHELTEGLIAEYGDVLPSSFIASTVDAAVGRDGAVAAEVAQMDVAAAAEAAARAAAASEGDVA